MKFSILQENLAKSLQIITRAIPTKSSLPILSNVLISTENGFIKLSATNLETAITTKIGASIEKEGIAAIPAKLIKEFVTQLNPGTLKVELKNHILHITSDKTKSKFNGVNPNDYPQLPSIPEGLKHINIDPKELDEAVSLVSFAAGTDSARPLFTGVYLNYSSKDNKLTIAAIDGFRLSEKIINVKGDADDFSCIIPAKTFSEVSKIYSTSLEPIKLILNDKENLALFESSDTLIATRLLDGDYPDYKKIIPGEHVLSAEFLEEDFQEAVKLTNIFAKEGQNTIKIGFDTDKDKIKVVSLASESGENESILEGELEGESLDIAFNSKYLLDFLNCVKTNKIHLETNGATSHCVLTTDTHKDFLHIIMPVHL